MHSKQYVLYPCCSNSINGGSNVNDNANNERVRKTHPSRFPKSPTTSVSSSRRTVIRNVKTGPFSRILNEGDSFRVKSIYNARGMPPSRILDLQISQVLGDSQELDFVWTAPGEDFDQGQATSYQLLKSVDYTSFYSQMNDTILLEGFTASHPAGFKEAHRIKVGADSFDTTTFYALIAIDKEGNVGEVSNIKSAFFPSPYRSSQKKKHGTAVLPNQTGNGVTKSRWKSSKTGRESLGMFGVDNSNAYQTERIFLYLVGGLITFLALCILMIIAIVITYRRKSMLSNSSAALSSLSSNSSMSNNVSSGLGGVQGSHHHHPVHHHHHFSGNGSIYGSHIQSQVGSGSVGSHNKSSGGSSLGVGHAGGNSSFMNGGGMFSSPHQYNNQYAYHPHDHQTTTPSSTLARLCLSSDSSTANGTSTCSIRRQKSKLSASKGMMIHPTSTSMITSSVQPHFIRHHNGVAYDSMVEGGATASCDSDHDDHLVLDRNQTPDNCWNSMYVSSSVANNNSIPVLSCSNATILNPQPSSLTSGDMMTPISPNVNSDPIFVAPLTATKSCEDFLSQSSPTTAVNHLQKQQNVNVGGSILSPISFNHLANKTDTPCNFTSTPNASYVNASSVSGFCTLNRRGPMPQQHRYDSNHTGNRVSNNCQNDLLNLSSQTSIPSSTYGWTDVNNPYVNKAVTTAPLSTTTSVSTTSAMPMTVQSIYGCTLPTSRYFDTGSNGSLMKPTIQEGTLSAVNKTLLQAKLIPETVNASRNANIKTLSPPKKECMGMRKILKDRKDTSSCFQDSSSYGTNRRCKKLNVSFPIADVDLVVQHEKSNSLVSTTSSDDSSTCSSSDDNGGTAGQKPRTTYVSRMKSRLLNTSKIPSVDNSVNNIERSKNAQTSVVKLTRSFSDEMLNLEKKILNVIPPSTDSQASNADHRHAEHDLNTSVRFSAEAENEINEEKLRLITLGSSSASSTNPTPTKSILKKNNTMNVAKSEQLNEAHVKRYSWRAEYPQVYNSHGVDAKIYDSYLRRGVIGTIGVSSDSDGRGESPISSTCTTTSSGGGESRSAQISPHPPNDQQVPDFSPSNTFLDTSDDEVTKSKSGMKESIPPNSSSKFDNVTADDVREVSDENDASNINNNTENNNNATCSYSTLERRKRIITQV